MLKLNKHHKLSCDLVHSIIFTFPTQSFAIWSLYVSVYAQYVFVQHIDHIIIAHTKSYVPLFSCVFKDAQTVKSFRAHKLWWPLCQANSAVIISSSFCLFFSLCSGLSLDEKVDFKVKEQLEFLFFYLTLNLRFLLESLLCCFCFLSGHTKFVFPSPVFFTRRVDAPQNAVTFQIDEWAFLSCQNVSVLRFSFPLFSLFAFASGLGRSV